MRHRMHPGLPLCGQSVQAGLIPMEITIGRVKPSQFIVIHEQRQANGGETVPDRVRYPVAG